MDQDDFARLISVFARRYYSDPRSTRIPVRHDRLIDLQDVKVNDVLVDVVVEDFAEWLKEGSR